MKNNQPVTQTEVPFPSENYLVSRTDLKGIITYVNDSFVAISGFSRDELIGKSHNIVRHPDMPRAAFKLAWDTIQSGKEFFGYIKNMAKDGSFYWVFTHISPDFDSNRSIIGYTSVRRCPKLEAIRKIEPVYRQMVDAERAAGARDAIGAGTQVLVNLLQQTGMGYEELVFSL